MRKLALLTTALLGLAVIEPSFAQQNPFAAPNQAGPQPGLPAGAGVGAVNAQPPRAAGQIMTTGPATSAAPMADMSAPPPARATRRRARRARVVHHHRARHHVAPAASTDAPATNQ